MKSLWIALSFIAAVSSAHAQVLTDGVETHGTDRWMTVNGIRCAVRALDGVVQSAETGPTPVSGRSQELTIELRSGEKFVITYERGRRNNLMGEALVYSNRPKAVLGSNQLSSGEVNAYVINWGSKFNNPVHSKYEIECTLTHNQGN